MNQAALHSNKALAHYDKELRQALNFDQGGGAEHNRPQVRSGRNISSQPYGEVLDSNIMENEPIRALIRIKADASRIDDDYDESICGGARGDASFSHPTPPRSALVFPASAIGGPGIDAVAQIATMQAKLNQRLGPEFISTRQGPGGSRLSYLEGWKAIELANEVFGFNGWSSSIARMDVDFLDEAEGKKWNVGVSVVMRITLRDGTFHEDIGYGHCENVKMKHQALEKARKEASTDALKRALRTFGRMLGNCLYDKKFVDTTSKLKTAPTKYDLTSLKRNCDIPIDVAAPPQAPSAAASTSRSSPITPQSNQHKISSPQIAEGIDTNRKATGSSSDKISKVTPVVRDQQANVDKPQNNAALSREERKAIAAAKQAAIRSKKEEERAKQDALTKKTAQSNPVADLRGKKSSQSMGSESGELGNRNVDECDLQLMEADFDDEDDLLEERIVDKPKSIVKIASTSSLEDSGIGLTDNFAPRQNSQRLNTAQGVSLKIASKGRFQDSGSPPQSIRRNDRNGGVPSSSPKVSAVRGRRLSMVGTIDSRAPSSSQSQRNRTSRQSNHFQGASSNNTARVGHSVAAGKRFGSSESGDHNVSIKRPRNGP